MEVDFPTSLLPGLLEPAFIVPAVTRLSSKAFFGIAVDIPKQDRRNRGAKAGVPNCVFC
jgi:hypothetical protein